jgi:type IV fimbrial biogenesis protein FimT
MSNAFLSQLHLARSEAIKRNQRVAMCKSSDGALCADSGGWDQGWIVFNDANDDGRREPGELLLYQVAALPPGFRLLGNTNVSRYVSFAGTGGTLLTSGAFQAGTLTLCRLSAGAAEAREIIISSVGRPRIKRTTVASCV